MQLTIVHRDHCMPLKLNYEQLYNFMMTRDLYINKIIKCYI